MGSNRARRALAAFFMSSVVAACTTSQLRIPQPVNPYPESGIYVTTDGSPIDLAACAQLFVELDTELQTLRRQDVQSQRIAGFPYLRIDRHYASYRKELQTDEQIAFWAEQLRQQDMQARRYELANLAASVAAPLYGASIEESLTVCGKALLAADLENPHRAHELLTVAAVPDSYSNTARVLGVYPVSRWFVSSGVSRLQQQIQQRFEKTSPAARPDSIRYIPANDSVLDTQIIADIMFASRNNALRIPLFSDEQKELLLAHFSPVLDIRTVSDDDRLGAPFWADMRTVAVNTADPVVYQMVSYTRINGVALPQLNYVFWFPARPHQGAFDLLAGRVDGITLRVTLDTEGAPLIYDAMHNCGCYHMYFPVAGRLSPAPAAFDADEPLLIPETVHLTAADRLLVQIDAVSHYITGVGKAEHEDQSVAVAYRAADYNELRSLERPNTGRRSLFGHDGIVPGSRRLERWLLWPMGILEPGAMRQWGHHATAFVGRRHFDDPFLLEQYFLKH